MVRVRGRRTLKTPTCHAVSDDHVKTVHGVAALQSVGARCVSRSVSVSRTALPSAGDSARLAENARIYSSCRQRSPLVLSSTKRRQHHARQTVMTVQQDVAERTVKRGGRRHDKLQATTTDDGRSHRQQRDTSITDRVNVEKKKRTSTKQDGLTTH